MKYEEPIMEIVLIEENVIVTSGITEGGDGSGESGEFGEFGW